MNCRLRGGGKSDARPSDSCSGAARCTIFLSQLLSHCTELPLAATDGLAQQPSRIHSPPPQWPAAGRPVQAGVMPIELTHSGPFITSDYTLNVVHTRLMRKTYSALSGWQKAVSRSCGRANRKRLINWTKSETSTRANTKHRHTDKHTKNRKYNHNTNKR